MLRVADAVKGFGGIKAVNHCSLEVVEGSITGLIGPNGAGKSTLFDLITGFQKLDEGEIHYKDERVDGLPPHELALRGLVRTFQITRPFSRLSVLENMLLPPKGQAGERIWNAWLKPGRVRVQEGLNRKKALELLAYVELHHLKDEPAGNLSSGQMKLLELARALMIDPQLLLLDEPLAGISPSLTKKLLNYIKELQRRGMTFFIVEHNMEAIMGICEKIFVLDGGRVISEGTPDEIRGDKKVLDAYLGV